MYIRTSDGLGQGQTEKLDCSRVQADCQSVTPEEQKKIDKHVKISNPDGDCLDRTEGHRNVNLALQLTHYDVNDWILRDNKRKHREALTKLREFIKKRARESDENIEVTVTGAASRTGTTKYNEILSCKRALCAAWALRNAIEPQNLLNRVRINPYGEGFTKAKCKGTECEQGEYRSVLISVHAPGKEPKPIPIVPPKGWDKYKIRCCSFKTETISEALLGDVLDTADKALELFLNRFVRARLRPKILPILKKILKENPMLRKLLKIFRTTERLLNRVLRFIPVEVIKVKAVIEIVERDKQDPKSITLCYESPLLPPLGVRVKFDRPDLLEKVPNLLKPLVEKLLAGIIPPEYQSLPALDSDCPGPFKDFNLIRIRTVLGSNRAVPAIEELSVFIGDAGIGAAVERGKIALSFISPKFADLRAPLKLQCTDCVGNTIPLELGKKYGFEIALLSQGNLEKRDCRCNECTETSQRLRLKTGRAIRPERRLITRGSYVLSS